MTLGVPRGEGDGRNDALKLVSEARAVRLDERRARALGAFDELLARLRELAGLTEVLSAAVGFEARLLARGIRARRRREQDEQRQHGGRDDLDGADQSALQSHG